MCVCTQSLNSTFHQHRSDVHPTHRLDLVKIMIICMAEVLYRGRERGVSVGGGGGVWGEGLLYSKFECAHIMIAQ